MIMSSVSCVEWHLMGKRETSLWKQAIGLIIYKTQAHFVCALRYKQYHGCMGVCQLRGQLTMPPRDPHVPPTLSTTVPAWYTMLRPRAVRPNPTDSILRNQVGYIGPGERTSRWDGRASQETSHRRAVRTWDRPQSYHTRSWAVKYLDQCLCPTAADPGAQQVASAMQYLAQPWFLHQRAILGASLMDSYRDVLDDLVRQSRHWHSLLRRTRVWTTSADQHYQRHNRRIPLFSVMSQLWASERAAHRVESPLPKRQCRKRPGILGQRPPPDMAPAKQRKLVTLEDLWGMAHA